MWFPVNIAMGSDNKEQGKEVEAAISEYMVDAIVSRHGFVPDEEVDRILDKFTTDRSSLATIFPFARMLRHAASPFHCLFDVVVAALPLIIWCGGGPRSFASVNQISLV